MDRYSTYPGISGITYRYCPPRGYRIPHNLLHFHHLALPHPSRRDDLCPALLLPDPLRHYFYPRRGLYLAVFCASCNECLAYVYVFPDTGGLIYTTGQAILFICIAAVVAYFTEKVNTSESRYRSIFETSLLGIVLFDQNTFSIRLANSYLALLLGYSEAELTSMGFSQLFHAKEGQRRFFEYLGSHEDITNFETTFAQKTGNLSGSTCPGAGSPETWSDCSVIDINQRKLAEQAAEENYTQYKQVTENAPTCIIILRENKIVFANPTFRAFTGRRAG